MKTTGELGQTGISASLTLEEIKSILDGKVLTFENPRTKAKLRFRMSGNQLELDSSTSETWIRI